MLSKKRDRQETISRVIGESCASLLVPCRGLLVSDIQSIVHLLQDVVPLSNRFCAEAFLIRLLYFNALNWLQGLGIYTIVNNVVTICVNLAKQFLVKDADLLDAILHKVQDRLSQMDKPQLELILELIKNTNHNRINPNILACFINAASLQFHNETFESLIVTIATMLSADDMVNGSTLQAACIGMLHGAISNNMHLGSIDVKRLMGSCPPVDLLIPLAQTLHQKLISEKLRNTSLPQRILSHITCCDIPQDEWNPVISIVFEGFMDFHREQRLGFVQWLVDRPLLVCSCLELCPSHLERERIELLSHQLSTSVHWKELERVWSIESPLDVFRDSEIGVIMK